jgi:hypothetical protein
VVVSPTRNLAQGTTLSVTITQAGTAKAAGISVRAGDKYGSYTCRSPLLLTKGTGMFSVRLPRDIQLFKAASVATTVGRTSVTQPIGILTISANANRKVALQRWQNVCNAFAVAVNRASKASRATKARAVGRDS